MKKSVLATLTVAALSVSPLALAQSAPVESTQADYLAARTNMDSPANIRQALNRVQAEQNQADRLGDNAADAQAGFGSLDTQARIDAAYQRIAENRALAGSGAAESPDYLAERRNIDSLDHINNEISKTLNERVSQL